MRDFSDTEALDNYIRDVFGGGGIANVSSPLKHRSGQGSTRSILSPIGSTAMAIRAYVTRAERNLMAQEIVKMVEARKDGRLDRLIHYDKDAKEASAQNSTIAVLFKGKKKYYVVDPELYGPLTNCFAPTVRLDVAPAVWIAKCLRTGATTSPSFIIRNFFRDTFTAGITSNYGFIPIVDSVRGALKLINDKEFRNRFYTAGVSTSSQFRDRTEAEEFFLNLTNGKSKEYSFVDLVKSLWNYGWGKYSKFNELIEACTRAGLMDKAEQATGKGSAEAKYEAIYKTINFLRSGTAGQQVNRVTPFFNAFIQGGDLLYQAFHDDPVGTMLKISKYVLVPSLVLWLANSDEDWYKELDPRIKMNYWCLPGRIRIQKSEYAVIFGSGLEAMLDIGTGKDPKAGKHFKDSARNVMLPNIIPTAILPLLEWQANYSFFRDKPIVNKSLQKLPDEMQYGNYTPAMAIKLGKMTGQSPDKIYNLWTSITGTMGAFAMQTGDLFDADKMSLPEKKTTEKIVLRDFFNNDYNFNRTISDFFELADAADKKHRAEIYNGTAKLGKPAKDVKEIQAAQRMITKAYAMKNNVEKDTHLNSLVKRTKTDAIDRAIKRIAQKVVNKYGKQYDIT